MDDETAKQINSVLATCTELKAQNKLSEVAAIMGNLAQLFPLNPVVNCRFAHSLKDIGNIDAAEKIADEFLRVEKSSYFIGLKFEILAQRGLNNQCIDLIQQSIAAGVYTYDLVTNAALFYMEENNFAEAKNLIKNFLQQNNASQENQNRITEILAIIDFLEGKIEAAEKSIITIIKTANPQDTGKLDLDSMLDVYTIYLHRLFKFRHENPQYYSAAPGQKIYMIGDSHVLSPAYLNATYKGEVHQIVPRLIFGCKAWHLYKQNHKTRIIGFKNIITAIPAGSTVFISLGEIDCRINEGIFSHYLKNPNSNLENSIETLVNGYVDFVSEAVKEKNFDLKFYLPPAPNLHLFARLTQGLSQQQLDTFITVSRIFGEKLKAKAGMAKVIDLFSITADKNGISEGKQFIDKAHLLPNIYPQVIGNLS